MRVCNGHALLLSPDRHISSKTSASLFNVALVKNRYRCDSRSICKCSVFERLILQNPWWFSPNRLRSAHVRALRQRFKSWCSGKEKGGEKNLDLNAQQLYLKSECMTKMRHIYSCQGNVKHYRFWTLRRFHWVECIILLIKHNPIQNFCSCPSAFEVHRCYIWLPSPTRSTRHKPGLQTSTLLPGAALLPDGLWWNPRKGRLRQPRKPRKEGEPQKHHCPS